jgi:hypothetical protein
LIQRLLILVPILCGLFFATWAQPPLKPSAPDTLAPLIPDTLILIHDSIPKAAPDSLQPHQPETPKRPADSLKLSQKDRLAAGDSLNTKDSLHAKDSLARKDSLPRKDSLTLTAKDNLPRKDSLTANRGWRADSLSSGHLPGSRTNGSVPFPGARGSGPQRPILLNPASLSNLHRKAIPVKPGTLRVDSASLVPGAFAIAGVPDSMYTLDWVNATLSWKSRPNMDSVVILYRAFPYRLNTQARRFSYDSIENYFLASPYAFHPGSREAEADFFNFGNITYNGSFGRSISFGNSQDAVVTSNLNLQISGYLADSIKISAAITDNNIPIQPDGTTANLNEFDKIFLQFSKKNWSLTMGDIDLRQNQNYFLNFYKRMQGASFETTNQLSPGVTNKTLVSAAIAKGKFNRNIFQGQEGNQGPYKLTGANNELYFIVLAGTEKVYIDGKQMQRGEDQDYTINYNTAEVTFTANRMITQDVRIQVEFEYADRNYLNVNLYLADEVNFKNKLRLRAALFSNSDSRNSPINQTLDPGQTKFLAGLGDSIQHAFYPISTVDTFAAGKILYKKVDTTYKNAAGVQVHDSIYVFSAGQGATLYNLSFANVGIGYGNYVPDLNGVNGNVYIWIAPVNGVMQGSYEAAQFLVTPKTQRVLTLGADYTAGKHTSISAEVAKSHYDVNTLSSIDKVNDDGYAAKFQLRNALPLGPVAKGMLLSTNLGYEYVQARFRPLERLRPVEFTRDWGLGLSVAPADERIYTAGMQVSDKKLNSLKYEIARYDRGDGFTGIRNILTQKQDIKGWHLLDQLSLTTSDSTGFSGRYWRPSIDISKKLSVLKNYTLGASYALEDNENRDKQQDTLSATSYEFQTYEAYLKSPEKNPNRWGMDLTSRTNAYPYGRSMINGDQSQNVNIFADLTKNLRDQFHFNATYRKLEILRPGRSTQTADNSLLGRAEYIVNEWKGLLRGNLLYEVGSGQEQKKNFTYLLVPAGTGQYTWIDANGDGIQQLTEFVLAQFSDQANYIRVYTPTDQYVKANYNTFNYSFTLTPKALMDPHHIHGFDAFLARIVLQSSLQLNEKVQARGFVQLNPFKTPLDDTSLITRNIIVVNTLSFNRSDPHWGFDLSNTRNGAKTLLTYGYESKQLNEWTLRTRINISRVMALNTTFKQGVNQLFESSSNFDSSNYNLQQFSLEPALSYIKSANMRVGVGYKLSYKQNALNLGDQKFVSGAFTSDFKYNIVQSASLQGRFTVNTISYMIDSKAAATTSPVAYTILEGLLPGKNYLWDIDFTKKLGSSLELSLQYEGRKAGETNIVHTGRASLRALL